MREEKKKRLATKGWKVGSASAFLGLSKDEETYIEIRLRLAEGLKNRRLRRGRTQLGLAKALHSSQSRIAKMEASAPGVTLDLMIRALLALGTSKRELAAIIAGGSSARAA